MRSTLRLSMVLAGVGLLLAACSSGAAFSHVHNISYDGSALVLGTHEGVWTQAAPSEQPVQTSREAFDVMGFAQAGERWLASGHPAHGGDGPADIGVVESTDKGVTWTTVALAGEVDFHRLTASGDRIYGISSADGSLLRSDDGGLTWQNLGPVPVFDIAADPSNADVLVGTTENGLVRSTDGGRTFAPIPAPGLLALVAWSPGLLAAVDVDGAVQVSRDGGSTWQAGAVLAGQPLALANDGTRIAVLVDDVVHESEDGGATFTERLAGIHVG